MLLYNFNEHLLRPAMNFMTVNTFNNETLWTLKRPQNALVQ